MHRRDFVRTFVAGSAALATTKASARLRTKQEAGKSYDVAVIGAGVFGSWTAHQLVRAGNRVILLDAYGAANSRASSGGESRVIRMGYGRDETYTRWSLRSLDLWQELIRRTEQDLFHETGVLWMAREKDAYIESTLAVLEKLKVPYERLQRLELEKRFPQVSFGPVSWGVLEPRSGVLMARRAVHTVVREAIRYGLDYRQEAVEPFQTQKRAESLTTLSGSKLTAGVYVFACGPWLPKMFPGLLRDRIRPTRQEVFYFGTPRGSDQFSPPSMPAWIDFGAETYGIPDLENRGFKIAPDRHGPVFDPDDGSRIVSRESVAAVRAFLGKRFPALSGAPLLETRVCQYENTSNGDFLIDRHPEIDNVWLVGGGSGHGFKHGPALGEYVASRLSNGASVDPRFSLATKKTVQGRTVY